MKVRCVVKDLITGYFPISVTYFDGSQPNHLENVQSRDISIVLELDANPWLPLTAKG